MCDVEAFLLLLAVSMDSGLLTVDQLKVRFAPFQTLSSLSMQSGWKRAKGYVSQYELDVPGASKRLVDIQRLVDQCGASSGLVAIRQQQ